MVELLILIRSRKKEKRKEKEKEKKRKGIPKSFIKINNKCLIGIMKLYSPRVGKTHECKIKG